MEFLIHDSSLNQHPTTRRVFEWIKQIIEMADREGRCFYKYPLWEQAFQYIPDLVILDAQFGLTAIDVKPYELDSLSEVGSDRWLLEGNEVDSPLLALDDFAEEMRSQFNASRLLRRKASVNYFLCFPHISRDAFQEKFPTVPTDTFLFDDYQTVQYESLWPQRSNLAGNMSALFLAIGQGDASMNDTTIATGEEIRAARMGDAIKLIDKKIRSLDVTQLRPEIQVPDGPQRLRGLAGTGKTIILARRAALLHNLHPEAKVLYTFHTQSLYNQIRRHIEIGFPRGASVLGKAKQIDWNNLVVRHSFGGKTTREGVYSRTCARNSIPPKSFWGNLDLACQDILQFNLVEEFDYVLIDEAQDLPPSFFQLVWKITKPVDPANPKSPKRIMFAYDELQSLTEGIDIKDTTELFGVFEDGTPRVDFSAGSYGDGIEMDYVLKKTYRNPFEVLMVAHGLGLGVYNQTREMQISDKRATWEAIGYSVAGDLRAGEHVQLTRDSSDSRSLVHEVYSGPEKTLQALRFSTRDEEQAFIVQSIKRDIFDEGVPPEDIVVVALDTRNIDSKFRPLQQALWLAGIQSIIPGVGEITRDRFAESGKITLSTVFKAKGNEAYIVYIMYTDFLFRHYDFVNVRNRVFTSISRTKGWCRLTGIGVEMDRVNAEIAAIQHDIPSFKFIFPQSENIKRSLSREELAETKRKRREVISALKSIHEEQGLINEAEAIEALRLLKSKIPHDEMRRLLEDLEAEAQENAES